MEKSVSSKTLDSSKELLFNSFLKFFNEETGLLMSELGSHFISLHHSYPENSHQAKEIKKLLMNLKSIDSEIEGNSIFDSFCFKTILEAFNNAKISEETMKDVQIDQFLLSVNFCGL
jgi:hypothetical protein